MRIGITLINIAKRLLTFLIVTAITVLLGCIYGILNDQITYTISPEYFLDFKFPQFFGNSILFGETRLYVTLVGILATYHVSLLLGIIYGIASLFFSKNAKAAIVNCMMAVSINLAVILAFGLFGYFYGKFYLQNHIPDWWYPEYLISKNNFIVTGSIHNFSYAGSVVGLALGLIYLIKKMGYLPRIFPILYHKP